ncbi:MAG: transposase, partial [Proteobacteria bacterium]|nr:transposase [Pseudomonadota bacterium]
TGIKKNMQNKLMLLQEKILLRKRSIIETVNGVLKEDFQLSHTRHRSFINGFIHIFSTLVAYVFKSNKPAIKLHNLFPN